ncbi:glycosyltransferase [Tessaracoccus sp. SD287]|uniref:glycosyltransferase family protein n=1 Tax=Tessaracoccus sp. SD287 TaxID=2782008 RepID=UPI001A973E85|nr:glycosyltransferase [Tessaracoccus sp. SD287]MBO1031886.1 glycosyltransferase [Tessaracoccus sp. SD287]
MSHVRRRWLGQSPTGVPPMRGRLFTDDEPAVFHRFERAPATPSRNLRVAIIADAFTREAFAHEWQHVEVTPKTWPQHLDEVDLLFVESAWHGNDDAWQYQITGSQAPSAALRALVEACQQRGIPTVFWNKEDPTHFDDFIDTAAIFDHVFTTDVTRVEAYRQRLGHDRVEALPFAVQERITNPVRRFKGQHERGVAFAGTWFAHKFPERRDQMQVLFDAAIAVEAEHHDSAHRFEIFSRFQGLDQRYEFPQPYADHVVGSLTYDQMLSAYRAYRVFLNVNTVTESPTMFARRLLEITACGTPVVTTPAAAVHRFLGEGVAQVSTTEQATDALRLLLDDPDAAARMVHLGQRELWRGHTYSHRVDQVLRVAGLPGAAAPGRPRVSVLMATRRPEQLDHALAQVTQQRDVDIQLLLGTHGFQVDERWLAAAREQLDDVQVIDAPPEWMLGDVLNHLVERADAEVVSKMDDDDLYGPHYLADLLAALRVSDAEVVGKQERWVHLAGPDLSVLTSPGMAWRPTNFVAGPTITTTRELAARVRFPSLSRSEDTGFLAAVMREGGTIQAADPFNFVQMRSADAGAHTWSMEDDHFLRAERQVSGRPEHLIFL